MASEVLLVLPFAVLAYAAVRERTLQRRDSDALQAYRDAFNAGVVEGVRAFKTGMPTPARANGCYAFNPRLPARVRRELVDSNIRFGVREGRHCGWRQAQNRARAAGAHAPVAAGAPAFAHRSFSEEA